MNANRAPTSKRPYLLRAMHGWMSDNGYTPHVIVDATREHVEVPAGYAKDGRIVLNVGFSATQRLVLGNDWVEFDGRFGGVAHHVRFPVSAALGIYARETGEGMVFSEQDAAPPEPPAGPTTPSGSDDTARRPKLTVVK